ncbi:MAG: hypothetical protein GDA40_06130 [Rhodobacteraceae bacterium]|nr:hypothetical protein [Paracoccaceae bacterium]
MADILLEQGLVALKYQWRDRTSGDAATFDLGCLDGLTGFSFRLQCKQWKRTRAALEAEPLAEMHFGWAADNVHQTDDKITLTLIHDGETREETGPFSIGADGASSAGSLALSSRASPIPNNGLLSRRRLISPPNFLGSPRVPIRRMPRNGSSLFKPAISGAY